MNYTLELYRQMIISLRRGKNNRTGNYSNAKPIFLLAILNHIPNMKRQNQFIWGDKELEQQYKELYGAMESCKTTPFWKPFYFMSSEPFYALIWKEQPTEMELKRPSGKLLTDYLECARLDDALWNLLQEPANREYLRGCIIKQYLTD